VVFVVLEMVRGGILNMTEKFQEELSIKVSQVQKVPFLGKSSHSSAALV
jgi:hypothetical protein